MKYLKCEPSFVRRLTYIETYAVYVDLFGSLIFFPILAPGLEGFVCFIWYFTLRNESVEMHVYENNLYCFYHA